jgi:O-antigen ligase
MKILKKNFYENVSGILLIFLPVALVIGQLLSEIIVIFISLGFLLISYKKKLIHYFHNYFFYFFLCFWIYLVLNGLLNNQNFDTVRISLSYIRFGIFFIAIVYLLNFNKNIIYHFFLSFFILFYFFIFDGFFQFFNGSNIFGYKLFAIDGGFRLSSFFGDEYKMGSYLSRLFPIFFGMWLLLKKKFKPILNLLVAFNFVLIDALIFLSGERASFFFYNLSAIFMMLLLKENKFLRFKIFCVSLLIIVFISIIYPVSKNRILNLTKEQMFSQNKFILFSEQHTEHYVAAYKMFNDNKLYGIGIRNFRYFCGDEKYLTKLSCSTHPHNTYIQVLSETGVVGFAFILFLFLFLTVKLTQHLFLIFRGKYLFNDFEIAMLSAIFITLWPIIPSGNFFNGWLNIIYYLPIGFLIWSLNKRFKIISYY